MTRLTPEGKTLTTRIAEAHGVSPDAVETLLFALVEGGGTQAQFNHPDLGGMGQWSAGGMTMVGDMFNNALKARVDALCSDLAQHLREDPGLMAAPASQRQSQGQPGGVSLFVSGAGGGQGWPAELGTPSSTGSQNAMRYAVFPGTRRLAIAHDGGMTVYDTGDHVISGVSQQQGSDRSLTFVSQHGLVSVADLSEVAARDVQDPAAPQTPPTQAEATRPAPANAPPQMAAASPADDILALIRKLADLKQEGLLTEEEFAEKKADLLSRL